MGPRGSAVAAFTLFSHVFWFLCDRYEGLVRVSPILCDPLGSSGPLTIRETSLSQVHPAYSHVASRTPSMCSQSFVAICRAVPKLLRQHALALSCAAATQGRLDKRMLIALQPCRARRSRRTGRAKARLGTILNFSTRYAQHCAVRTMPIR